MREFIPVLLSSQYNDYKSDLITTVYYVLVENNRIDCSGLAVFVVILIASYPFASANTRRSSRFSFLELTPSNASEAFARFTKAFVRSMCYILIAFLSFCHIIAEETISVVFFFLPVQTGTQLQILTFC